MAKNPKVAVEITATDDATPTIAKLEKRIDGLEADEARILVDAATEQAQRKLDTLTRDVDQLDGDEATVRARAIDTATDDLRATERLLADLDGETGTVRVDADTGAANTKLDGLVERFGDLDAAAGGLPGPLGDITAALGGMAGPAALGGVVAGMFAAAQNAADVATEVATIAEVLGTTTEDASRLRVVFGRVGIEAGDLQDIALQITGALDGNAELMDKLRISTEDAGQPVEALRAGIESWDFLTATERSAAFGEEGVRQIGQLIASGEDLDDLLAGVDGSQILSAADIAEAREMKRQFDEIRGAVDGLVLQIGNALIPGLADAAWWANQIGDALDAIPGLETEGLTAGAFTAGRAIVELFGDAEEASNEWVESTVDGLLRVATQADDTGDEIETSFRDADPFVSEINARIDAQIRKLDNAGRAGDRAGDDIAEGMGTASVAVQTASGEVDKLRGQLDVRATMRQFTHDSWAALAEFETNVLTAETAVDDWKRAVLDTAEELGNVPDDVVVDLIAQADDGLTRDEIARTQRIMQGYATNNPVNMPVRVELEGGGHISNGIYYPPGGGRVPLGTRSVAAPTSSSSTTNVFLARPDAIAMTRDQQRWSRINGAG